MSHNPETVHRCPNCGFEAQYNYCAECGQSTHLHKETFMGLVGHFVGHYFHYDSKFWQTMKALWFSPGKLTTAYWKGQRMRYIPPISLYIFISAVFFLSGTMMDHLYTEKRTEATHSIQAAQTQDDTAVSNDLKHIRMRLNLTDKTGRFLKNHPDIGAYIEEQFDHNFPKFFFFLIPFMALVLQLLFFRRKDLYFVDHAIFSLHIHSLGFSVLTLSNFLPPGDISSAVSFILSAFIFIYLVLALHKTYNANWVKSIVTTAVVAIGYFATVFLIILGYLALLFFLG